jgi:hypothetical protein
MVGYVAGRFLAASDPGLVSIVYLSTYVLLAGLGLCALVLVAYSAMTRRPLILRSLAAEGVFGVLIVLFPYSRWVALPGAVIFVAALVLLVVGWKDLNDPKVWNASSQNPDRASGR